MSNNNDMIDNGYNLFRKKRKRKTDCTPTSRRKVYMRAPAVCYYDIIINENTGARGHCTDCRRPRRRGRSSFRSVARRPSCTGDIKKKKKKTRINHVPPHHDIYTGCSRGGFQVISCSNDNTLMHVRVSSKTLVR